jgi:DNA helicase II / ATP-dependent DNA helicase PcrA
VGDEMKLNEEQEKVIDSTERFLFLLAGAGSGKTRVIVEKIKRLVDEGVEPTSILAITFTRKSANEMKERVNIKEVAIHTFHQFCYLGLEKVYKETPLLIEESKLDFKKEELLKISKYKNSLYRTIKPKSYDRYQTYLELNKVKDFDDLLLDYLKVLKRNKEIHSFKYIFIDEFQDTNLLQYELLKQLINCNTTVLAVGDPDQSIYQFRGANAKIIDLYLSDFQAIKYTLSTNYRSNETIINHANKLIGYNNRKHKKQLKSYSTIKCDVFSLFFNNELEEALQIIHLIKDFNRLNFSLNEVCVLYRNHYRSYELKHQLSLQEINYQTGDNEMIEGVHLLSIHQAKGLEFDIVIIIGLEKGLLPSNRNNTQSEHDEERRLMFVAITRARHHLIFSHVLVNSSNNIQKPSQFITESGVKHIKKRTLNGIISLGDFNGH